MGRVRNFVENAVGEIKDFFKDAFGVMSEVAQDVNYLVDEYGDDIIDAAEIAAITAEKFIPNDGMGDYRLKFVDSMLRRVVIPGIQKVKNKEFSEIAIDIAVDAAKDRVEEYVKERNKNGDWSEKMEEMEKDISKLESLVK